MSMTYRPSEKILKEIKVLKEKLGIKASSKVLDHVLLNFDKKEVIINKLVDDKSKLQEQLREMKYIIIRKGNADFDFNQLYKLIK